MESRSDNYRVDFAIVTPLLEEWEAVRARLADAHEPHASYLTATGRLGQYRVVVCKPAGQHNTGNPSAAAFTTQVVNEWAPRWVLLAGVAGSLKGDVNPGDVVLANKILGYEYGKIDNGVYVRRTRDDSHPADEWLDHLDRLVRAGFEDIAPIWNLETNPRPDRDQRKLPVLHLGPIASGDKVIDDPEHLFFVEARKSMPNLLAIEMEGAGASTAIKMLMDGPRVGFLMVRGISDVPRAAVPQDLPDNGSRGTGQRDSWKPYAAAAAAAVIEQLLSRPGTPAPVSPAVPRHTEATPPSPADIPALTSLHQRSAETLGVLQELGIVGSATRLQSSQFEPKECIEAARRKIDFMGILASKWVEQGHVRAEFEKLLLRLQSQNSFIRFLLIDPACPAFKNLKALRGGGISTGSLQSLRTLSKKFPSLQVRLYDQMPTFRLIFIDDTTLAISRYKIDQEGYFQSQYGWEAPHLVIRSDAPWSLYDAFATFFEETWRRSKPL